MTNAPKTATAMPAKTSTAEHQFHPGTTPEDRIHRMHIHPQLSTKSSQNEWRDVFQMALACVCSLAIAMLYFETIPTGLLKLTAALVMFTAYAFGCSIATQDDAS